jgi:hypothetical protein
MDRKKTSLEKICQVFIFNWVFDPILRSYSTPEFFFAPKMFYPQRKTICFRGWKGVYSHDIPMIVGLNPTYPAIKHG